MYLNFEPLRNSVPALKHFQDPSSTSTLEGEKEEQEAKIL